MDSTAKTLVQYVRDENNNPVATFVAFKTLKSERFTFGWSKYNLREEVVPFSKEFGKKLATSLGSSSTTIFVKDPGLRQLVSRKNSVNPKCHYRYIPRDLEPKALDFLTRASKYFKCSPKNVKELKASTLEV